MESRVTIRIIVDYLMYLRGQYLRKTVPVLTRTNRRYGTTAEKHCDLLLTLFAGRSFDRKIEIETLFISLFTLFLMEEPVCLDGNDRVEWILLANNPITKERGVH